MRNHAKQPQNEYSLANAAAGTILLSVVTLLCFYSAVWMAQDIFPDWKLTPKAVKWLFVLLTGTAALYQIVIAAVPYRLLRALCQISVPLLYGAAAVAYAKPRQIDLEDGACALATQFLVKFNKHVKTSYWIWSGKTEFIEFAFAFWGLVVIVCLLLLAVLLRRRFLLLLLPIFVLLAELTVGYAPQWRGMVLFFAALLFVRADGEGSRQTVLRVPMNQRHGHRWYMRLVPFGVLAAAMLVMLSFSSRLSSATTEWMMAKAPGVQELQRKMERTAKDLWRGRFSPKSEAVTNQTPHYTGQNMLLVTASARPSEDLLLRGFCGTDYVNGSWICDTQPFSEACAQAGYDEAEAAKELFDKQYKIYRWQADRTVVKYRFGEDFYAVFGGASGQIDYTVSHLGARSTYAYVPYGVSFGEQSKAMDAVHLVADAKIEKERGRQDFAYSGWNYAANMMEYSQVFDQPEVNVFQWYDGFAEQAYRKASDRVPSVHQYLQSAIQDYVPSMDEYMQMLASSYAQVSEDGETLVPTWESRMERNWDMIADLQQELTEIDHPAWINMDRLLLALAVSAALQKYQSYSMNLEPLTEGEDPVTCFLMRTRKGYCVHFASAAVLFLRELGVPARYVTGYVVRSKDFQSSGDSYAAYVKDSDAHAWAEIYLEQVGWVPIDVTPPAARDAAADSAGAGVGNGTDTAPSDAQDTLLNKEETHTDKDTDTDSDTTQSKDPQKEETDQKEETGTEKKSTHWWDSLAGLLAGKGGGESAAVRAWKKYGWIAAVLGVAALLSGMCLLCKRLFDTWRTIPQREIRAGKYRKAVFRMNRRIYRRLCIRKRCTRLDVSDAQYEQLLKMAYQKIFAEDWTQFMQIVRQAAYAYEEVAAEDARFCWRVYAAVFTRAKIK